MGQEITACVTPDEDTQIKLLQEQLKEQEKEKLELERKIAQAKKRREENDTELDEDPKIQELKDQKKKVFRFLCCPYNLLSLNSI